MKQGYLLLIIFLTSCSNNNRIIVGNYKTESYHQSFIKIDTASKFMFYSDSYRLLIEGQNRFWTEGTWSKKNKKTLLLNSTKDTILNQRFILQKQKLADSLESQFVFIDQNSDTVLTSAVYKNSELFFYRSHGPYLTNFKDKLFKGDTLLFGFSWGFEPLEFLIVDSSTMKYTVILKREFKPNYFKNTEFIIKSKKLINKKEKAIFKMDKRNSS